MASLIRAILLAEALKERFTEQAQRQASGGLVLIEVRADHQHLHYLPLELIGQRDLATDFETVAWRGWPGSQERRPSLRFLAARSAPQTVSVPQNEEEFRVVQEIVAARHGATPQT